MTRTTFSIDGMTCGHCVRSVRTALEALEGVQVERVEVGTAVVSHDPAVTPSEKLAEAIADAGYVASAD